MAMKAPRELEDFCRGFHQDAFRMNLGLPEVLWRGVEATGLKQATSFDDTQEQNRNFLGFRAISL